MITHKVVWVGVVCIVLLSMKLWQGFAQTQNASAPTGSQAVSPQRDGQHDFDWNFGAWKTHQKRLLHPLTNSTTWVEYDGTDIIRSIWGGRASLGEIETDGPAGHLELLSLRLYNPVTRQWSFNVANSATGTLDPMLGEFKDGQADFTEQEPINGRSMLVRMRVSDLPPNAAHFEQAFSDDAGKTWETNFVVSETLMRNPEPWGWVPPTTQSGDNPTVQRPTVGDHGPHDFDFDIGTWKVHIRHRQRPLSGSDTWSEYDGTDVVRQIWNGRANLAEVEADGPSGHLEFLSLRLYNPESHQWSLNVASSQSGTVNVPAIGEFKNGRGEFYDQETVNGRAVLARTVWSDITPNSYQFEESLSDDGGKTWEPDFVATLTRETHEPSLKNSEKQN